MRTVVGSVKVRRKEVIVQLPRDIFRIVYPVMDLDLEAFFF